MKRFGKVKWALAGSAFMVLALVAGTYGWLRTSLPDYSGTRQVAGISGTIEIVRDARAVPHIFAATRDDGYFGLGFVHGQDRLWALEMTRRAAHGRLAEAIGADGLSTDKLVAALDIEAIADRTERQYSPATRAAVRAYVAGINAALDARRGALPPEFLLTGTAPGRWEARDVSRVAGLLTLGFGDWRDELLRARLLPSIDCAALRSLFASPADSSPVTHPDAPQAAGVPAADTCGAVPLKPVKTASAELLPFGRALPASNSWAVAGTRTASGKPLLANDPHGPLTAPADYYPVRIVGADFELVGASRPGVPGFATARNRDIAWGITDVMADQTDLFIERVDPADPTQYMTPTGPQKFVTRTVTIPVKDKAAERIVLRYTAHGPVLSDIDDEAARLVREQLPPGHVVALAGVDFPSGQPIMEAFVTIAAARDWPEFERAIASFHFQHNFAFADRSGTIAMATAARIPRRGGDGFLPAPGWNARFAWTGYAYPQEMPRTVNPASGFVANANNRTLTGDRLYDSTAFEPGWRAARIVQQLGTTKGADRETMRRLQLDTVSAQVAAMKPVLAAMAPATADGRAARDMLRRWNGDMATDRAEPLIWSAWYRAAVSALLEPKLGALAKDYLGSTRPRLERLLAGEGGWCAREACPALAARALDTAVKDLRGQYGDMAGWRWGDVHRVRFKHDIFSHLPLVGPHLVASPAAPGDATTVNAGLSMLWGDDPYADVFGARYRQIVDLADPAQSLYMIAPGMSGNVLSPWFGHLAEDWAAGRYFPLTGSAPELRKESVGTLTLKPR
ncbi:penicillin acylase family protein [uncultured Sphingosinicella sp.]|uniref:penicillin acylase family protein n=1 Tax=uncultured Sphingosinicella sp. TaxID=478748 RepID=UPI0030D7E0FB|tara:strand:- start:5447 stop:7837 length:2391 start_codon:yes stop_codon:yes gene_type:complete